VCWHIPRMIGRTAVLLATLGALTPGLGQDPWPEFQRTPSRLGRTDTIGPQTPTIAWSIRADPTPGDGEVLYTNQPVMDAARRIFVGGIRYMTAIDSIDREIEWAVPLSDNVSATASVYQGRVLFGSPNDFFYCFDAATGEEIWSRPAEPHPNRGNVVDERGVVYYPAQQYVLYARWVADGSEEWTHNHYATFNSAPALDGLGQLYIGNGSPGEWLAFHTADAEIEWTFPIEAYVAGTSPVENGRVYKTASHPRKLHCINAETGDEIWSFDTETTAGGGAAIRHDGVIYVNASGGSGWLFAVTPDGHELWRYPIINQSLNQPPMIDGAGTAYFCTYKAQTDGWVHAVRADGSGLWIREMPNKVAATPMLAPDGTLYVMCKDKYLYAFHDPPNLDKTDAGDHKQATDVRALP
jgi:outer membrane protein assembly factor BamB